MFNFLICRICILINAQFEIMKLFSVLKNCFLILLAALCLESAFNTTCIEVL
jgi:hypothetical protein